MSLSIVEVSGPPYGNFDECLGIESPPENDQSVIRGKYCYSDASFIRNFKRDQFDARKMPDRNAILASLPINGANFYKNFMGKWFEMVERRNETRHLHASIDFVEYLFPRDIKLTGGFCVPTTCKTQDISRTINQCEFCLTILDIYHD